MLTKRIAFLAGSYILATLLAGPAYAQQPAQTTAPVLKLSLNEAVQLGLKQNPQRVLATLEVAKSKRASDISRSFLLPQASLGAAAALAQYNLHTVEANPPRKPAGPYQYAEAGPAFSQTVFSLPTIRGYQAGREGVRQATATEEATREDVVLAVVDQYLLVLRAMATRDAAEARVALARRLFEQAEQLQRTGVGLNIDTVRANVELQNERQNLIDADTATRTTRYFLAELLDLPKEQEVDVTDHMDFFDLPDMDREEMLSRALRVRPEMRAVASEQRISALQRKSFAEERYPELNFSGFWMYQGEHFSDGIPAYHYQLSLDFPLFTGGRIHAEIERGKLQEKEVSEERRQLEAQIVREVKSSLDELTAARTAVDVANQGFDLANQEVAQAQRRFAAGVTTNVEVITAQDALARASDNQIAALYRFNQARAALAHAMGEIENTYSK
ncbi:MAG TPA: TolC family protein [Dongiaceae bacterium]|nr:TolC family protein [Dongiaceae bacterium]